MTYLVPFKDQLMPLQFDPILKFDTESLDVIWLVNDNAFDALVSKIIVIL